MKTGGCRTLIQKTYPEDISLEGKNCFMGIGFSHRAVPIDVVGLLLAGQDAEKYTILLVDEFLRLNGASKKDVDAGVKRMKTTLDVISDIYGVRHDIMLCSDFMHSNEYRETLKDVESRIESAGIVYKLLETVPKHKERTLDAIAYPLNEIPCVEFLRKQGADIKIGPKRETLYDEILRNLENGMKFAYTLDAYPLAADSMPVVPYTFTFHPRRGEGYRLFLEDPIITATNKLNLGGSDKALRYFVTLASAAGERIGKTCVSDAELNSLDNNGLKTAAKELILENIIKPYKEAIKNGNA